MLAKVVRKRLRNFLFKILGVYNFLVFPSELAKGFTLEFSSSLFWYSFVVVLFVCSHVGVSLIFTTPSCSLRPLVSIVNCLDLALPFGR